MRVKSMWIILNCYPCDLYYFWSNKFNKFKLREKDIIRKCIHFKLEKIYLSRSCHKFLIFSSNAFKIIPIMIISIFFIWTYNIWRIQVIFFIKMLKKHKKNSINEWLFLKVPKEIIFWIYKIPFVVKFLKNYVFYLIVYILHIFKRWYFFRPSSWIYGEFIPIIVQ